MTQPNLFEAQAPACKPGLVKCAIHTLGIGDKSEQELIEELERFDIRVIGDVRSAVQHKAGCRFYFKDAEWALGKQYTDLGLLLDGDELTTVIERVLSTNKTASEVPGRVYPFALLGAANQPEDCIRARVIGRALLARGLDCRHIYRDEKNAVVSVLQSAL